MQTRDDSTIIIQKFFPKKLPIKLKNPHIIIDFAHIFTYDDKGKSIPSNYYGEDQKLDHQNIKSLYLGYFFNPGDENHPANFYNKEFKFFTYKDDKIVTFINIMNKELNLHLTNPYDYPTEILRNKWKYISLKTLSDIMWNYSLSPKEKLSKIDQENLNSFYSKAKSTTKEDQCSICSFMQHPLSDKNLNLCRVCHNVHNILTESLESKE